MAGLDGIENKIHPGEAMDKNLYDLPTAEKLCLEVPDRVRSLREALEALSADHEFLLKGDVFTKDQIEAYAELKWEEVDAHRNHPLPGRIRYVLFDVNRLAFLPRSGEEGRPSQDHQRPTRGLVRSSGRPFVVLGTNPLMPTSSAR